MSIQIGELVVDMRADVARIRTDMDAAKRLVELSSKDIVNRMEAMRGAINRMDFIAVWHGIEKGVGYATSAISGLKRTAIDSADQLNKLSQSTGWSTETLSAMRYAAEMSDIELEGLTKSLKHLSTGMFDAKNGNKEMAATFASLKVPLNTSEEALLTIAERFSAMPDGAQKAALAVKLFGKEGMTMIPFLNQGRDGIAQLTAEAQRMGLVIADETARQAEAFNDNLKRLDRNLTGIVQQLGASVMPTLLGLSERLLDAKTQTGGLDENIRRLAGNRTAMESFLESTAVGLAHVAEEAVLLKRVLSQPFSSAEAVGVDVRTWLEKDALKSMKAMGFNQAQIDAAINDLEHSRAHYMDVAGRQLAGLNDNPGYVSGVKKFFDEQRRTVRVEGHKFVLDSEAQAKEVQAIYDKYYAENPKKPGGVREVPGLATPPKLDIIDPFGKERAAALKENLAERDRLLRQEFDSEARLIDEWGDRMAGIHKMDSDLAKGLSDVTQSAYGNAYTGRFDTIAKQLEQYVHQYESSRDLLAQEFGQQAPEQMLFSLNAWSDAAYKLAAAEGAGEEIGKALAERQQRLATLSAMVTTGLRTETEARREGIAISRDTLDALTPNLAVLKSLAATGYPPAVKAMKAFEAELITLRDLARDKDWLDGIQAGLRDYAGQSIDTFVTMRDTVKQAFKGMEDSLVEFVKTGKMNFGSLVDSVLEGILRIQIQESLTKPMATALGGMDFSFLKFWADGGIPGGTGLHAYANRVVTRPTLFAFASGAGLMGEAGPEAIMPLKRGSDGKLGVAASGSNVVVNVINNAQGAKAEARERSDGQGNRYIDIFIEQVKGAIAGDIARGSGPITGALASTYGLNRVAGAY